jgi:hypothetical protein
MRATIAFVLLNKTWRMAVVNDSGAGWVYKGRCERIKRKPSEATFAV